MADRKDFPSKSSTEPTYEHEDTQALVTLVTEAAHLLRQKGESAFLEFRAPGSRWNRGETYIFVIDPAGNMLVHPDPLLEGKNEIDLKDLNGKPIIRGLLEAATSHPTKAQGWYHYQWPVPGGIFPRWKSSFVRAVQAPSGKRYIVGCGIYNDRMERVFVKDAVESAVEAIEKNGRSVFPLFHDPKGPYLAKDSYIFVYDRNGVNLVTPPFPNLEGQNLINFKDTQGKHLIQEMLRLVESKGEGWVDYLWPKPGESVSTAKSAYVKKAKLGDQWLLVGCGVYLAKAPKAQPSAHKLDAIELMSLVRDAAAFLQKDGENAFPELHRKGSRWYHDDLYFFVWDMLGKRELHAADPAQEGRDVSASKDILGRPYGKMILEAVQSAQGEGWVHYMYPEPENIFPTWKSTFVKRVTFPSGKHHIVGCGIYNMQMHKTFIEDLVLKASQLIQRQGRAAFPTLRDKTGPFVFMDTYVFVLSPEGLELVNGGLPGLEGRNLLELEDIKGHKVIREEIETAMNKGSAWLDYYWYEPGTNSSALKQTYVRKVASGGETFIVGSGVYLGAEKIKAA